MDGLVYRSILAVVLIIGVLLVTFGNTVEGWSGTAVMTLGIACHLVFLYLYNRRYK